MDHCLNLLKLPELADSVMVNELKTHCTLASAPTPSVETLLHACLPFKYVDHTHADAVVTLTNLADGEARCREVFGDRVLIVPYVMPGYDLAKYCADLWSREGRDDLLGLVLLKHGIFSHPHSAISLPACTTMWSPNRLGSRSSAKSDSRTRNGRKRKRYRVACMQTIHAPSNTA